ncbi:MAG: BamA/TamA family outer membrane protein [Acidobacteriota bacterium]|nr:BamA/TamA family outer membrane protein [Acidobacteriota bacterium]MDQ3418011.1 BamA/TamA family outer membrane protein [Acidobacteriota bacterium]
MPTTSPTLRAVTLTALLFGVAACKEEGAVKVTGFTFEGNQAVTSAQLKQVLATQASSKLPWGTRQYFSREQFEADLKRIVAFYTDRGFPNARVTSFNAQLNEDQTAVKIDVTIDEGQPLQAERVVLEGFEGLPAEHRTTLDTSLPLKASQPLDRAILQASRETLLDELRDHGHPYASVRIGETPGSDDHQRVITFHAEPGPVARHGEIDISGNTSVSDNVVRRQLSFKPGDLYQLSKLRESQRRLYGLELFNFANVQPLQAEEKPTIVPTRVTVTEGKHRKVTFGVGYGTEEKARAEVDWRHVNFFGGARTAGVLARYSGLDGGVRLNFNQPYLFSPAYSLSLTGQVWHADEPAFDLETRGGRATVTRQFARGGGPILGRRPTMTLSLAYANEWESFSISNEALNDLTFRDELIALGLDPRFGTGTGQRSALLLDASRNMTDNLVDAKRGYLASVHMEKAGSILGGTYDYYELTGEGRYYLSVANKAVIAAQVRGGSIAADGDSDALVPFQKRYFLGGASNLRGWGRFEVSPLSGGGLPIGGTTFMNFSAELRVPVWSALGGVIFLDGGNVWTDSWDFNLSDLRYDVGPGLRYTTPIGPLRVDLGYQLNPLPGLLVNGKEQTRRFRFHFSFGQAF